MKAKDTKNTKNDVFIIDVWNLQENHKLPCHLCEKEYTRLGMINHLVKQHGWKRPDAKNAFKEIKLENGQKII